MILEADDSRKEGLWELSGVQIFQPSEAPSAMGVQLSWDESGPAFRNWGVNQSFLSKHNGHLK